MYHLPVLLRESIDGLCIKPEGIFVDVTFGGGGHSKEILKLLNTGHLYAFDQDPDSLINDLKDDRFTLVNQNFIYLKNYLRFYGVNQIDGLLADLGVSSHQFDKAERGFSIRQEGILDLRMNPLQSLSAKEIVNTYDETKLKEIFQLYGELPNASKLASVICMHRKQEEISTTFDLKKVVEKCIPRNMENKFLAMLFQALRIEVNQELEALKSLLQQTVEILKPGGRMVFISYHSLEDRLVKNFIKAGNFEGNLEKDFYGNPLTPLKSITRKPITPSQEELAINNRSRSAKLRIAEKK